jgi:tetratricopeptide (TPR) repeat protein
MHCSLLSLGDLAREQGDLVAARAFYEENLAVQRELGRERGVVVSLNRLGLMLSDQHDYGAAQACFEESLALGRKFDDRHVIAASLRNLGLLAHNQSATDEAVAFYWKSLDLWRELGDGQGVAECLEEFASLAVLQGQAERGTLLLGAAHALREAVGVPRSPEVPARTCRWAAHAQHQAISALLPPSRQPEQDEQLAALRQALGEAAYSAAWEAGQALTWEQAVAAALGEVASPDRSAVAT